MWRKVFAMPMVDPRARAVTVEQAILDLVLFEGAETTRRRELDRWYASKEAENEGAPEPLAPEDAAGNTDPVAAMARLKALTGRAPEYEPVDLDEED